MCIDDGGTAFLERGREYVVECVDDTLLYVEGRTTSFFCNRFKLVEEKPKQISFKDFLRPLRRVELRSGDFCIFVEGVFVGADGEIGKPEQYLDNGKVAPPFDCALNKGLEVVRVWARPQSISDLLNPEACGNWLWVSEYGLERGAKVKALEESIHKAEQEYLSLHFRTAEAQKNVASLKAKLKEIG